MNCVSSSGPSVHELPHARILEWIAIPSPRDLPNAGIELAFLMPLALIGKWVLYH